MTGEVAATLLGAAHTIRGAFDEGSLDAPGARNDARGVLGEVGSVPPMNVAEDPDRGRLARAVARPMPPDQGE
jgi:hypothetical protein